MKIETSWGGEIVAPRRGKMYGCFKPFHVTASLQNNFWFMREYADGEWRG